MLCPEEEEVEIDAHLSEVYLEEAMTVLSDPMDPKSENIYEEECGGLSMGYPHAELFLRYPAGLGMDVERFHRVTLDPDLVFVYFDGTKTRQYGFEDARALAAR